MEEFIKKSHRHHVREIPLAPVLDLLVVVIFFLVLSTSFTEFTKQTVPPSAVSTITDPVAPPPIALKMLIASDSGGTRVILKWGGEKPDQREKLIPATTANRAGDILTSADELVKSFMELYPKEKSVQLALGATLEYQDMVSAMDGLQKHLPDVVLVSAAEADAIARGTAPQGN